MSSVRAAALLVALVVTCHPAPAAVVINEILYHAPDDLDDLQFIELHNTGDAAIDLVGWKLTRGVRYEFPRNAKIEANGYLVICKNLHLFKRYYGSDAAGQFEGSLSHGRGHIELIDAKAGKVDEVQYRSRAPWPVAADGYSSSLERICPTAPAGPENWAPSPLPTGSPKPGGTPGKKNSNYAPRLPPVVSKVTVSPTHAVPGQQIKVEADVRSAVDLRQVKLRYRIAGSGFEKEEATVRMTKGPGGCYAANIPGQKAGQIVRLRIHAVDDKGGERFFPNENEVRPALSLYVHEKFRPGAIPFGLVINVGEAEFRAAQNEGGRGQFAPPAPKPPPRGKSAFVYVNPRTGEPELFDFINVTPRGGGRKVRFHKDHTLAGMTTINLIYEYMDRFVLAEPLAYEVYRKAGNNAPRTDHLRTWIDGRPIGFQLLIEQPNRSFLRHNDLRTDGNLYKCQWFGRDLVSGHEKKNHTHEGHDDLVALVDRLNKTRGDEQWAVIKKHFDVEQVVNYFAVNMVLSHWDGYFNNYFTYHDVRSSGKWTMYPWDQDKTWGFHDGIRGYEVFFDMPLTFGMAGDVPPGWPKDQPPPGFFGGGPIWWRPGGYFSKPLFANPTFRKLFLARTKELLEKVYTEEVFFPLIKAMGERLEDEVKVRAELRREDPKAAVDHLRRNLDSLREHLQKRRKFLLGQDELKKAGKFDRSLLK
ncbi:MAG TPA: CotH kinase family protein [Gemmataceae bacterium]|nr:CotH kinase family protein [Gemmataceae bacterium]